MAQWMFLLISAALILAIGVWVPMALWLAVKDNKPQSPSNWKWWRVAYIVCAVLGIVSFFLPTGIVAACAASAWLLFTIAIGLLGLSYLNAVRFSNASITLIAFGMIFLPVGGIWLAASRLGYPLLGFEEPLVSLTAAHFHYTGLATTFGVGLAGRVLPNDQKLTLIIYRLVCISMVAAVPLVATGINGHPLIEKIGVAWLSGGLMLFAGLLVQISFMEALPVVPRVFAFLAAITIVLSMSLAMCYRFHFVLLSIPQMLATHGALNAFVFVPLLMLSFLMLGKRRNA